MEDRWIKGVGGGLWEEDAWKEAASEFVGKLDLIFFFFFFDIGLHDYDNIHNCWFTYCKYNDSFKLIVFIWNVPPVIISFIALVDMAMSHYMECTITHKQKL